MSRNLFRVAIFDVAVPVTAIAGLLGIGAVLGWPVWWVSVASILVLLIVQAVVLNVALWRRDAVTLGTDDDRPGLRLTAVAAATAALLVAVGLGYLRWTVPDRDFARDSAQAVRAGTEVAEATATFAPGDPTGSIDRAAALMVPERAEIFRTDLAGVTDQLVRDGVTTRATTASAGLEALGPDAASVVVLLRSTRTEGARPPETRVLALRVALTRQAGRWLALDVVPIHGR